MSVETRITADRRAAIAIQAAKVFGLPEDPALAIYDASGAMSAGDLGRAATLAAQVARSNPDNIYPWLILGMVALDRLEGATAQSFFERAREIDPKDPNALGGLGKAVMLQADPFGAVDLFAQAFEAGGDDMTIVGLYKDLMSDMGRQTEAADVLSRVAERQNHAWLFATLGDLYLDSDHSSEQRDRAIAAFSRAWALDPTLLASRVGRAKTLVFERQFEAALGMLSPLLAEHPELGDLVSLEMTALRNLGRHDAALSRLDAYFEKPEYYKRALAVAAHIQLDRGELTAATRTFRTTALLTDHETVWSDKALGTHCFSLHDYAGGARFYMGRMPAVNRKQIPAEASAPENLAGRDKLFLLEEQGIGDQLALLPLVALAPLAQEGREVIFIGDHRMEALLKNNTLGVSYRAKADFDPAREGTTKAQLIFVGDLARYLPERAAGQDFGGYLRPDAARTAAIRARYAELAAGASILGLAWSSRDYLTGAERTLPLSEIVARLPKGAFVVSLQYGDCAQEIAAARAARPDVTIFEDPEIDQMADLAGFAAQIMALDRVVTIDNTTAHICGALAHPDCHLLLPTGAPTMWYWERQGTQDPWYGALHLHRQDAPFDWTRPLAEIAALWPQAGSAA